MVTCVEHYRATLTNTTEKLQTMLTIECLLFKANDGLLSSADNGEPNSAFILFTLFCSNITKNELIDERIRQVRVIFSFLFDLI